MKRRIFGIIILMILTIFLVACGNNDEQAEPPAIPTVTGLPSEEPEGAQEGPGEESLTPGEEGYPAPAQQEPTPLPEGYPEPAVVPTTDPYP